ncbi:hypothetical protein Tco_0906518 [Tanacetum coccineum]|uniref:DNA-directed RNA polymerase n=1 Tax=Tanacetum coccineum TaxID=301880 RepID=A0ABQ5CHP3_9ASTR
MIRNKARLVAQGYTNEEGMTKMKIIAPVAKIERNYLFLLSYHLRDYMDIINDVQRAHFSMGILTKKVNVLSKPPGFEDPDFLIEDTRFKSIVWTYIKLPKPFLWENLHSLGITSEEAEAKGCIFISPQDKLLRNFKKKSSFTRIKTSSNTKWKLKACSRIKQGEEEDCGACAKITNPSKGLTSSIAEIKKDLFSASVEQDQWLQIPQQKLNMWLLQVVVDKCFGFKINYLIMGKAKKSLAYEKKLIGIGIGVNTVDDDKETTELKQCMEIIPDEEEVIIDAIPLAVKIFSQMIKSFDEEDLEDLYKLVKARYGSTRPVESMDYLLLNYMKIMFEPHVEDESMQIYMLVEKKYPLTPPTLSMMLEKKLQIDYESEMAYQLCKLIIKQLKNQ